MNRAHQFAPLQADAAARWSKFGAWERTYFPSFVGLVVEEIRVDYCRMRLPYRPELDQPAGIVHGGAIATLLDTVMVPAVGSSYPLDTRFSTVDMHIQFLSPLVQHDAVAEGWIVKRGRRVVFCEAEVRRAGDDVLVARSMLTYNVSTGNVSTG